MPVRVPAASNGAATNGVRPPETHAASPSSEPLTKRQRVQLVNKERRKQQKAAKREAAAALLEPQPLPPPHAPPVDKVIHRAGATTCQPIKFFRMRNTLLSERCRRASSPLMR